MRGLLAPRFVAGPGAFQKQHTDQPLSPQVVDLSQVPVLRRRMPASLGDGLGNRDDSPKTWSTSRKAHGSVARQPSAAAQGPRGCIHPSSARIFGSIIVTEDSSPAGGPPFVKAINVSVFEHIADPHIDPFARTRFTQAPRELGDEPLPLLHFGQVGHGTRRWRNSASLSRAGFATSRGRHGLPNSAALTWH